MGNHDSYSDNRSICSSGSLGFSADYKELQFANAVQHSVPSLGVIPNGCEQSFRKNREGFLPSVEMTDCGPKQMQSSLRLLKPLRRLRTRTAWCHL